MYRIHFIAVWLLGVSLSGAAQTTEALPRIQWSYGLHLEQYSLGTTKQGPRQVSELAENGGVYFDAEARVAARFSWLLGAGYQRADGWTSWGELPLDNVFFGRPEPDLVDRRLADNVTQHWRRIFLGGGAQVNFRIGTGDLSLGGLLTVDRTDLQQTVAFGRSVVRVLCEANDCPVLAASSMLDGTSTVRFAPVYRAGGRLRATYTRWLSGQLAVRIGGTLDVVGPRIAGDYREGGSDRFAVAETENNKLLLDRYHDWILPTETYFKTPSPTATYWQPGVTVGIVYKPPGEGGPVPPGSRFGLDLDLQSGVLRTDEEDARSAFTRQIGLAVSYDTRTKWLGEARIGILRQTASGFRGAYHASGVLPGPDGLTPAAVNLRTSVLGWSAYGLSLQLSPSLWREQSRLFSSVGFAVLFLDRQMSRSEWFAQNEEGDIYGHGRTGYRLTVDNGIGAEAGSPQRLLHGTAGVVQYGLGYRLSDRLRLTLQHVLYFSGGKRMFSRNQVRYLGSVSGVEVQLSARLWNPREQP